MDVIFIDKEKKTYRIKQEEVYNFCKNIFEQEISRCEMINDIEKISEYKEFVKKYKTFNPYFDFVMFKMKYTFSTPLSLNKSYIKANDELLYAYENIDDIKGVFWGYKSDDETLKIDRIDLDNIHNCFIDGNGICYGMEYGIHEGISNTLLNNLLINNPNISEKFYDLWKDLNFNIRTPLLELFGYLYASVDSSLKLMLYNPLLLTDNQRQIIMYIKEYLYNYMFDYCKPNSERKEKIKELVKGVKYENR